MVSPGHAALRSRPRQQPATNWPRFGRKPAKGTTKRSETRTTFGVFFRRHPCIPSRDHGADERQADVGGETRGAGAARAEAAAGRCGGGRRAIAVHAGAGAVRTLARLFSFPFTLLYLLLYAAAVHVRRSFQLSAFSNQPNQHRPRR